MHTYDLMALCVNATKNPDSIVIVYRVFDFLDLVFPINACIATLKYGCKKLSIAH
jgi:hypothetical protein